MAEPDQSDWSPHRRKGYQQIQQAGVVIPAAVLKVPALGIEAGVYPDVSRPNLERGAGWVPGTAGLGEGGNVGIAAVRPR